jgi:hypothetical protein
MSNKKSKFFIAFTFLFAFFYVLTLPFYAYALTYNAFMNATASGKVVVETAMKSQAGRYIASRGLLRVAGAASGYLLLAVTVYSLYDQYKDLWQVGVTIPSGGLTPVSKMAGDVSVFGNVSTNNSYSCESYSRATPTYVTCFGYPYAVNWSYVDTAPVCPYATSSYVMVGGKTNKSLIASHSPLYSVPDCQHITQSGSFDAYLFTRTLYYASNPMLGVGAELITAVKDNTQSAGDNARIIAQTIQDGHAAILNALEAQTAELMQYASPLGSPFSVPVDPWIYPDEPSYIPLSPQDYIVKNLDSKKEPVPASWDFTSPPPAGELPAPPISDGFCGDYQYKNNWDTIKTNISTALLNLPLYGLINKLADLTGQGGFPHQYTLDLSSLGYGHPSIDLDAWHFNDMLAVLRWAILAGSFILAWKIAVGGD